MTDDLHRPDPEFVDRLTTRIEADDLRLATFAPRRDRPRRTRSVLTSVLVLAVVIGSLGVVAAGRLDDAGRKRLYLDRARLVLETSEKRRDRLAESLGEAKRAWEAGFLDKGVVEGASLRVQLADLEIERHRLELAEIEETGRPARSDCAAPPVGSIDHVGERLRLELRSVELGIESAKAERNRRIALGAAGFETAAVQDQLERSWQEYRAKAQLVRHAADAILKQAGVNLSVLDMKLAALRNRARIFEEKFLHLKAELLAREPLQSRIPGLRKLIEAGEYQDLAAYGASVDPAHAELSIEQASLEALMNEGLGRRNAKVVEQEKKVLLLWSRLRQSQLGALDRWTEETTGLRGQLLALDSERAMAEQEFAELSSLRESYSRKSADAERFESEAARYRTILDKLRTQAAASPPEPPTDDASRHVRSFELERNEILRRLAIRAEFLAGKLDAATAALREDRSEAVLRAAEAELALETALAALDRTRRAHLVGIATKAELRDAESEALDLETQVRVAKIDIAIIDDQLER